MAKVSGYMSLDEQVPTDFALVVELGEVGPVADLMYFMLDAEGKPLDLGDRITTPKALVDSFMNYLGDAQGLFHIAHDRRTSEIQWKGQKYCVRAPSAVEVNAFLEGLQEHIPI